MVILLTALTIEVTSTLIKGNMKNICVDFGVRLA